MGEGLPLLPLAALSGMAGVAVLRLAWHRARRSPGLNALGWTLLVLAAILGGAAQGAWGVAVASLFAMALAFLLLAFAAGSSPPGKGRASNRRVAMLPEAGEPRRIGRRVATFLIVVAGGLLASIALGVALRAGAVAAGWSEANANAAALFAVPIAWGVLAFVLLMQERRRAQLLTLLGCAVPLLPFLITGAW